VRENKYDYLIVGAGIIGLTIAKEIKKRFPLSKIGVLEKEKNEAEHSSGRNSRVLQRVMLENGFKKIHSRNDLTRFSRLF